jgi:hypothetical protein
MGEREDVVAERIARNQDRFRAANERIESFAEVTEIDLVPFICECPIPECTELTKLSLAQYEEIRGDPRRFFVVPGHEVCEIEGVTVSRVTTQTDSFSVLEKIGKAGEVAAELDTRDRRMDERARRIALNEALFRRVNEEIESLERGRAAADDRTIHIICECADLRCGERVSIPVDAYEKVRADSSLFLVVPTHELADVEDVVQKANGYAVVRKRGGEAKRLAETTDPRS